MDQTLAGMEAPKRALMAVLMQDEWRRRQGLPPEGSAILLVGAPGVGKSQFAKVAAAATGRPLRRLAVGDERDTAVRLLGTSRHFLHSNHGEIATAFLDLGSTSVVLLIDEVDKLMQGENGEAVLAILLTITDHSQSDKVIDLHIGPSLPMNCSRVLWFFTANRLDTVHPALRDRCSAIELAGYTADEKRAVVTSHVWPRQLAGNRIPPEALRLSEEAVEAVISRHEREPGLRGVERDLRTLMSAAVPRLLAGEAVSVSLVDVHRELGEPDQPLFTPNPSPPPGEALALATNGVAGHILPIQVAAVPGAGRLLVTGLAGIEMEQAAGVALTYLRTHAADLGLSAAEVNSLDYHVHLPGAGIVKHGPSAGLAQAVALYSRLTGKPVPGSAAMTGDVDLQGGVRGVGGVLAKLGAARQAGLGMVLVPASVETDDPLAVRVSSVTEALEKLGLLTVRASGGSPSASGRPPRRATPRYQRKPAASAPASDPTP
jgi:ATP-dependent Lon protease